MIFNKKIAVIYTGEVRTIEKTIKYLKKNVLLHENVHVFAVLQSNNIGYYDNFVKNNIGTHLKSLEWFHPNNDDWLQIREQLLDPMSVSNEWKSYLKNSGSMIEYYQMFLAYQEIKKREYEKGYSYDYILRIRCDVILTHPIYFDWDDCSIDNIKDYLYQIKKHLQSESILCYDVLQYFMNTFYHKDRLFCKTLTFDNYAVSDEFRQLLEIEVSNENEFIEKVYSYFKKGKYIITLRSNQIYFIKRQYFENISKIGITYGNQHIMPNNNYWFNSESQIKQICLENNVDIFDSTTLLEGQSLYEYNENNYFENGELKQTYDCLFFIKRI